MKDTKLITELEEKVKGAALVVQLFGYAMLSMVITNNVICWILIFVAMNAINLLTAMLRVPVEIIDEETDEKVVPVKKRNGFIRYYK